MSEARSKTANVYPNRVLPTVTVPAGSGTHRCVPHVPERGFVAKEYIDGLIEDVRKELTALFESYTLQPATTSTLGGVIVGDGLDVDVTGLLSLDRGTVSGIAQTEVAKIVDGAPKAFDTLKEISDWIAKDETGTAALIEQVSRKVPLVQDHSGNWTAASLGLRNGAMSSVGHNSLTVGMWLTVSGDNSAAIGDSCEASGQNALAVGESCIASGQDVLVVGYRSSADERASLAVGEYCEATGGASVALGLHAKSFDIGAFTFSGFATEYHSHGRGTFNVNPVGGLDGFFVGDKSLPFYLKESCSTYRQLSSYYPDGSVTSVDQITSQGLEFTVLDDDNVAVSSTTAVAGDIVVPWTVTLSDGVPRTVTEVESNGFSRRSISTIRLPSTVRTINQAAFYGCKSLTKIVCPSVETIGASAFQTCSSLAEVVITSAKVVNKNAFFKCTKLVSVYAPQLVQVWTSAFNGCTSLAAIDLPSLETVEDYGFVDCSALASVKCPRLKIIGQYGFSGCTSLAAIDLPSLETVEDYGFRKCTSLTKVDFPHLRELGPNAFTGSFNIHAIYLPMVESIGDAAFDRGLNLSSQTGDYLSFPSLRTVGSAVLTSCKGIQKLHIPFLQSAGEESFASCEQLHVIDFGSSPYNKSTFISPPESPHDFIPEIAFNTFNPSDFFKLSLVIIVPLSLYDDWVHSASWSRFRDNIVSYADYKTVRALKESLQTVATTGSYASLKDKPKVNNVELTSKTTLADLGLEGLATAVKLHAITPEVADTTVTLKPVDGTANHVGGKVDVKPLVELFPDNDVLFVSGVLEYYKFGGNSGTRFYVEVTQMPLRVNIGQWSNDELRFDIIEMSDTIYDGGNPIARINLNDEPITLTNLISDVTQACVVSTPGEYLFGGTNYSFSFYQSYPYSVVSFAISELRLHRQGSITTAKSLAIAFPTSADATKARKFSLAVETDTETEKAVEWRGGEVIEAVPGASRLVPGLNVWDVAEVAPGKFKVERASSPAQSAPLTLTAPGGRVAELTVGDDLVLEVKEI